jgi:uncharacterized protein DUF2694
MTEADPAFDTVHPSGHILVRSCRGGYLHSVTLSEAAMNTDAESLAEAILLTSDVSYLKAVMEVPRRNRRGRLHPVRRGADRPRSGHGDRTPGGTRTTRPRR